MAALIKATKYTPARACTPAREPLDKPDIKPAMRQMRVPVFKRPAWQDVDHCARYGREQMARDSRKRSGVNLFLPTWKAPQNHRDWRYRELREGGCLYNYLRIMRHRTPQRWRGVGWEMSSFKQNPKSDLRLVASVPLYDFIRYRELDKHFFDDESNLRSLRRDNPHIDTIYL